MQHNRKRWRAQGGFSLTEMLATVLIMSLVTLAIAAGITTAVRVYRQITLKADAQTLLATSIAAVNNDFATADFSYGDLAQYKQPSPSGQMPQSISFDDSSIQIRSVDRGYDITIHNGTDPTGGNTDGTNDQAIMVTDRIPLVTKRTRTFDLHNRISDIALHITYKQDPDDTNKMVIRKAYFTYTISVYSGEDEGHPLAEENNITVNDIFY